MRLLLREGLVRVALAPLGQRTRTQTQSVFLLTVEPVHNAYTSLEQKKAGERTGGYSTV